LIEKRKSAQIKKNRYCVLFGYLMRAGFYILISFSFIFSCYLQSKIKYSEFNPKALPFENDINAIYFTQKNKQVELGIILKKCADYCQKLSHSVREKQLYLRLSINKKGK